jgi:hypothetical protein
MEFVLTANGANLKSVGRQELIRRYNIDGQIINQYAVLLSTGYDGAVLLSEKPHSGSQSADLTRPALFPTASSLAPTRTKHLFH